MKLLVILFALVALIAEISEACNPATWTPREKEIYHCMRRKGWSNGRLRTFYNSVLKPGAGGRATCDVQEQVRGCITIEDFRYYGVTDACTPPAPPAPPQPQERIVYVYVTAPPPPVTSAPVPVTSAPVPVTSAPGPPITAPVSGGAVGGTPPDSSAYVPSKGTGGKPVSG